MHRTHLTLKRTDTLFRSLMFALALFASKSAKAQQPAEPLDERGIPEGKCFPNPAVRGAALSIQVSEFSVDEGQIFEAKIIDDGGKLVFSAVLPDELEIVVDEQRFKAGFYVVQFFQNGRLFETSELVVN